MPDLAPHQTPDYVAREFDRSDPTLGTEPRGRVSPEIEDAVRRAYEAAREARRAVSGA